MHCNLKRILQAVVNGATSLAMIKELAPDIRNAQHKLDDLVQTGYVERDENDQLHPTDKARKIVPGQSIT